MDQVADTSASFDTQSLAQSLANISAPSLESTILHAYNESSLPASVPKPHNALLDGLRAHPLGHLPCTALLSSLSDPTNNVNNASAPLAAFFSLSTIATFLSSNRVQSLDHRLQIRKSLLTFINPPVLLPWHSLPYILQKASLCMALLIKRDYPTNYPTAFTTLLDLSISPQPRHTKLFLLALICLIDEVVQFSDARDKDEMARNATIKDAMRGIGQHEGQDHHETPIASLITAMIAIIRAPATPTNEDLPVLSLTCLKLYLNWIDLSLIMSDHVLSTLYTSLSLPHLKHGAVDCVLEIVNKGMDEAVKLQLLIQLDLFPKLEPILKEALGRDAEDDELSLPVKVSEIVCAVGIQLFQIIDKTFAPGQAVGPIGPLLGQWMQLFLMCLQETQEVATQVLPLVSRFTITLGKQLQLHLQAQDPQEAGGGAVMTYLPAILHSLYTQSMYPPDHEFAYPSTASTRLSVINNSELDVDPAELFRGDVRKLWVKLVGKSPEMALKFICDALGSLPTPLATAPFPATEAALRLCFHYQEGLPPKSSQHYLAGTFKDVVVALQGSGVEGHSEIEIAMLYVDICVRYAKLVGEEGKRLNVISCIIRGFRHTEMAIRGRCCYSLLRLVKVMDTPAPTLATCSAAINAIQSMVAANVQSNYAAVSGDSLNYLFEAAGTLINNPDTIPLETREQLLSSFMLPQINGINTMVQHATQDPGNVDSQLISQIGLILSTIASLSKGFSSSSMTANMKTLFLQALQVCIRTTNDLPSNLEVKSKSIMLIHRTILLLEDEIISYIPSILFPMLQACDGGGLLEIVQLFNQIMIKFGEKVVTQVEGVLLVFLGRYGEMVPAADEGSSGQVELERAGIRKLYMLCLQHVVSNNCARALTSERNKGEFWNILAMMMQGVLTEEMSVKKSNMQFFTNLCKSGAGDEAYWEFVMQQLLVQVVMMMMESKWNVKDAQCSRVAGEFAGLLVVCKKMKGALFREFVEALRSYVGGGGKWEAALGMWLAEGVDEPKMKKALVEFLAAVRQR